VRTVLIWVSIVVLALALSAGPVQGQVPRQVALFPSAIFRGVATPGRYFYLAQAVVEYEPGAFSAAGSEQSRRFFTVMEGELTVTTGGKTEVHGAGKSFAVAPGVIVKSSNEGRTTRARVFVSSLVPARGEDAAAVAGTGPSSTPPRIICASRVPKSVAAAVIDVIQVGTRYEPGFATGLHTMNEMHDVLHLEGTTSYEYLGGDVERFGPCQRGEMYMAQPGLMANRTATPAVFVLTWLSAPGAALTSPWR